MEHELKIKFIKTNCQSCGNSFELEYTNQNLEKIHCPFCGSEELLLKNSNQRIQELKMSIINEIDQHEANEMLYAQIQKEKKEFNTGKMHQLLFILVLLFSLWLYGLISLKCSTISIIIGLVQVILCLIPLIVGASQKQKMARYLSKICPAIAIALIFIKL